MNEDFAGKIALVTGAARGIGRAIAERLHAGGACVLLVDCNVTGVGAAAASLRAVSGEHAESLVANLADPASITSLAEQVKGSAGRMDILVNNAGIEVDLPFEQVTPELFDRLIAINLRAPLRYLSNAWKRLEIMREFRQVRERELSLDRCELAEMARFRPTG